MVRQITDWGEISWLEDGLEVGLKAGIVTLAAGAHQPKHMHYEEQVIYVIQGLARSILDGVETRLSAGKFFHWKAGVEHEIYNLGGQPFKHILVSNPGAEEPESLGFKQESSLEVFPDLIYIAVEAIRTQFLETLHYGYAIFDSYGNLILQSDFYPEYCVECCSPTRNPGRVSCMRNIPLEDCTAEQSFYCENGMEVFQYPIFFRGKFLGYMQSGYIRHSTSRKGKIEEVYDSPESVVLGIRSLLRKTIKAIRNFCEFEQFRRELMEKELCISSQEEMQRILIKNLRDTQYAMTDLKINNHFLFNTLNSMASMALDEGAMALYQSIVDLSKMFHYTLRTQASMVLLEKEIDYVRAFLQLQKLRYGESLEVFYDLDDSAMHTMVPFNFLQPVAENAFVHGLEETARKQVRISVLKDGAWIEIKISNSGKKLNAQECRAINQGIQGNTSHGLSILYQKLKAVYKGAFLFQIGTDKKGNTCFTIRIPTEREESDV